MENKVTNPPTEDTKTDKLKLNKKRRQHAVFQKNQKYQKLMRRYGLTGSSAITRKIKNSNEDDNTAVNGTASTIEAAQNVISHCKSPFIGSGKEKKTMPGGVSYKRENPAIVSSNTADSPAESSDSKAIRHKRKKRFQKKRMQKKSFNKIQQKIRTKKKISKANKVRKTFQKIAGGKAKIIVFGILGLFSTVFLCILMLFFLLISGVSSESAAADSKFAYPADNSDITRADLYWTELSSNLIKDFQNIPNNVTGWQKKKPKYIYIEHNSHQLISFISAYYYNGTPGIWTFDFPVQELIEQIFNEQYFCDYRIVSTNENKVTLDTISAEELPSPLPQNWKITSYYQDSSGIKYIVEKTESEVINTLEYNLKKRCSWEDIIDKYLDDSQKEYYKDILQYKTNPEVGSGVYGNPFDFPWENSISSPFGYRIDPTTNEPGEFHKGLDIAQPMGTTIYSVSSGTVIDSYNDCTHNNSDYLCRCGGGYGNNLDIQTADGTIIRYAHCTAVYKQIGQPVSMREPIAIVGTTGSSTGSHLHIEIIQNGEVQNPLFYISTN